MNEPPGALNNRGLPLNEPPGALNAPARMPLVWVHPARCLLRLPLTRGELRRTRGIFNPHAPLPPLYTYDLGCPSCGARNVWTTLRGEPIAEGPLVETEADVLTLEGYREPRPCWRPATISTSRTSTCVGCRRTLAIVAGELDAT